MNHLRPLAFLVALSLASFAAKPALAQCEGPTVTASDGGLGDLFGDAIAISGERFVVGAPFEDSLGPLAGAAYVYERLSGVWTETQKLKASDLKFNDRFGFAVDISGPRIIVGTRYEDQFGYGSGAAYIFERTGGVWVQKAKLVASDPAANDFLAHCVAISGTVAVAGAVNASAPLMNQGAVYVFEQIGGVWSQVQKITAPDASVDDRFGYSADLDGNRLVVSAMSDDDLGTDSGSVYVFERHGGVFSFAQKLNSSDAQAGDQFGISVAVDGDRIIAGSIFADGAQVDSGAAYIFERHATQFEQVAILRAEKGAPDDYFGRGVAISGESAAVAAGGWDDPTIGVDTGAIFYYHRKNNTWTESGIILPAATLALDSYGTVGLDGGLLVTGGASAAHDHGAACVYGDIGSTYSYGERCDTGVSVPPKLTIGGCATGMGKVELALENAGAAASALLVLGSQSTEIILWPGVCELLVAPPLIPFAVPVQSGPSGGHMEVSFALPPHAIGTVYLQSLVSLPANPLGFINSNGVALTIH